VPRPCPLSSQLHPLLSTPPSPHLSQSCPGELRGEPDRVADATFTEIGFRAGYGEHYEDLPQELIPFEIYMRAVRVDLGIRNSDGPREVLGAFPHFVGQELRNELSQVVEGGGLSWNAAWEPWDSAWHTGESTPPLVDNWLSSLADASAAVGGQCTPHGLLIVPGTSYLPSALRDLLGVHTPAPLVLAAVKRLHLGVLTVMKEWDVRYAASRQDTYRILTQQLPQVISAFWVTTVLEMVLLSAALDGRHLLTARCVVSEKELHEAGLPDAHQRRDEKATLMNSDKCTVHTHLLHKHNLGVAPTEAAGTSKSHSAQGRPPRPPSKTLVRPSAEIDLEGPACEEIRTAERPCFTSPYQKAFHSPSLQALFTDQKLQEPPGRGGAASGVQTLNCTITADGQLAYYVPLQLLAFEPGLTTYYGRNEFSNFEKGACKPPEERRGRPRMFLPRGNLAHHALLGLPLDVRLGIADMEFDVHAERLVHRPKLAMAQEGDFQPVHLESFVPISINIAQLSYRGVSNALTFFRQEAPLEEWAAPANWPESLNRYLGPAGRLGFTLAPEKVVGGRKGAQKGKHTKPSDWVDDGSRSVSVDGSRSVDGPAQWTVESIERGIPLETKSLLTTNADHTSGFGNMWSHIVVGVTEINSRTWMHGGVAHFVFPQWATTIGGLVKQLLCDIPVSKRGGSSTSWPPADGESKAGIEQAFETSLPLWTKVLDEVYNAVGNRIKLVVPEAVRGWIWRTMGGIRLPQIPHQDLKDAPCGHLVSYLISRIAWRLDTQRWVWVRERQSLNLRPVGHVVEVAQVAHAHTAANRGPVDCLTQSCGWLLTAVGFDDVASHSGSSEALKTNGGRAETFDDREDNPWAHQVQNSLLLVTLIAPVNPEREAHRRNFERATEKANAKAAKATDKAAKDVDEASQLRSHRKRAVPPVAPYQSPTPVGSTASDGLLLGRKPPQEGRRSGGPGLLLLPDTDTRLCEGGPQTSGDTLTVTQLPPCLSNTTHKDSPLAKFLMGQLPLDGAWAMKHIFKRAALRTVMAEIQQNSGNNVIKHSAVAGRGLFNGRDRAVEPGERIEIYGGVLLTRLEACNLSTTHHKSLEGHSTEMVICGIGAERLPDGFRAGVQQRVCVASASWPTHTSYPENVTPGRTGLVNSYKVPNCKMENVLFSTKLNGEKIVVLTATQRVPPGDEFFLNYSMAEQVSTLTPAGPASFAHTPSRCIVPTGCHPQAKGHRPQFHSPVHRRRGDGRRSQPPDGGIQQLDPKDLHRGG
jgi:hypothetical protein